MDENEILFDPSEFDTPDSRPEEILSIIRTHVGSPAAAMKSRWANDGTDANAKENEMRLLSLMGLVPVVNNVIHYGDGEILEALSRMYAKMGVERIDNEIGGVMPGEIQERRILARTHYSQQMLKFLLQRNDTEEIYAARDEINRADKGIFRLVGSKDMSVDADVLTDMMLRERPQVVIVDYLTRLRGKAQCDLDCVNDAMPKIKDATQQAGCRTILLSQMSRQSKTEQAKGKLGGHSKGGGIVEELAHSEIELVKDAPDSDDEQPAKIIATITKNRRGPSGRSFSLAYIPDSMKFTGHAFPVRLKTGGREPLFTAKEETTE